VRVELYAYKIVRVCEGLDRRILRTVAVVVEALVRGGQLSVTALGRALRCDTSARHGIKRVDRLLSNTRLQLGLSSLYEVMARRVVRDEHPIILIDWSKLGQDQHVLTAALALQGRSIPLLNEVYSERWLGHSRAHGRFLKQLRDVLPEGCRPVLVTDAGFRIPFFQQVEAMGWSFVGRLDNHLATRDCEQSRWQDSQALLLEAASSAKDLGVRWFRKLAPVQLRVVLSAKPVPRRHEKRRCRNGSERKARKRAPKPWLLATNLENDAPRVVQIYRLRMHVEQWFRDTKNPRFGWALRFTRCSSRLRLQVLLLIAALATFIVLQAGLRAEAHGLQREFQASSRRDRRWLSLFFLGQLVLQKAISTAHLLQTPPPSAVLSSP